MFRQTTLAKLLILTGIIAVGLAFAPRIYNQSRDGLGDALAVVLLFALLFGTGLGVWTNGLSGAITGMFGGLLVFSVAALIALLLLWIF